MVKSPLVVLAGLAVMVSTATWRRVEPSARPSPLVVHEWGTFTSFQGPDGQYLPGLHREEEALPAFVHSPPTLAGSGSTAVKGLVLPLRNVTQKLETPVIYFYGDKGLSVRVRVDFPDGLLSQYFPMPRDSGSEVPSLQQGLLDLASGVRSHLTWDVTLLSPGESSPTLPEVPAHDPWALAREVRANHLVTEGPGALESERYLFYRGLGSPSLPVSACVGETGILRLSNRSTERIPVAYLVRMEGDGGSWTRLGGLDPGSDRNIELEGPGTERPKMATNSLEGDLRRELQAQGLYEDEAIAMVKTWSRQWFHSPGTRILYLLPRPWIDRMLPLDVTPDPQEMVRVLLGRLEILTPARLGRVVSALRTAPSDPDGSDAFLIRAEGRLLEPILQHLVNKSEDPMIRERARNLISQLP